MTKTHVVQLSKKVWGVELGSKIPHSYLLRSSEDGIEYALPMTKKRADKLNAVIIVENSPFMGFNLLKNHSHIIHVFASEKEGGWIHTMNEKCKYCPKGFKPVYEDRLKK